MYKGALELWRASLFQKKRLHANFSVVQNTITRVAHVQMWQFIHVINNDHGNHRNPLWKVQEVIDVFRQRLQAGWILGE